MEWQLLAQSGHSPNYRRRLSAMSGSPTFTCRLGGHAEMSFGQPSFPQSLLVSRQVFSTSIMAKNVFAPNSCLQIWGLTRAHTKRTFAELNSRAAPLGISICHPGFRVAG